MTLKKNTNKLLNPGAGNSSPPKTFSPVRKTRWSSTTLGKRESACGAQHVLDSPLTSLDSPSVFERASGFGGSLSLIGRASSYLSSEHKEPTRVDVVKLRGVLG